MVEVVVVEATHWIPRNQKLVGMSSSNLFFIINFISFFLLDHKISASREDNRVDVETQRSFQHWQVINYRSIGGVGHKMAYIL